MFTSSKLQSISVSNPPDYYQITGTACLNFFNVVTVEHRKTPPHFQFILPLHTAESISNVHFILNQNCNLKTKSMVKVKPGPSG